MLRIQPGQARSARDQLQASDSMYSAVESRITGPMPLTAFACSMISSVEPVPTGFTVWLAQL